MGLLIPEFGLLVWMVFAFGIVLFVLSKYAWKPILQALKDREHSIDEALSSAKKAREEVAHLHADNQRILAEARVERDNMMKEARDIREKIIAEAKEKAAEEAKKVIEASRETIHHEKQMALHELKNQITGISIEIAEKILERELKNPEDHKIFVSQLMKDIHFN
jgi:F-type H+-transporting ATPase subunit b